MNVEKSLQKAGVDTKEYPALSMQNILGYTCKPLGENSHWYKQIMEDGHVFNPYIHRRWLPHQFMEKLYWILKYDPDPLYVNMGVSYKREAGNSDFYCSTYQKLIKELNAQYTLFKRDRKAYKERVAAFDDSEAFKRLLSLGDKEGELTSTENYTYLKNVLTEDVKKPKSLYRFDTCNLSEDQCFRDFVATGFLHSGIYFTLKHIAMFDWEKLNIKNASQKDYLKDMRESLIKGDFNFIIAFGIVKDYVKESYNPYHF